MSTFSVSAVVFATCIACAVPAAAQTSKPADKPAAQASKPADKPAAGGGRLVEIFGGDDMKFSVAEIAAKPGEQLRIRLVSKGKMPKIAMAHNVVVLKSEAVQIKFVNAAVQARETDYIPKEMKDQVIAATGLAGPGETVEVTFKVPAAGKYPFVCTFPGHFQAGMKGTLVVK